MVVKDFSLVLFTILGQTAVGLTIMAALRPAEGPREGNLKWEWLTAGVVLALALVASMFHLGHPEGAVRTLAHLSESWLSREILAFGVFGLLLVVAFIGLLTRSGSGKGLVTITALVGIAALLISSMVYSPPSFPALNNLAPTALFLVAAFSLGAAFASYFFRDPAKRRILFLVLAVSLIAGLLLQLVLPTMWLSGGKVAAATASAYYASWLYWLRMAVGFIIPLATLAWLRGIPPWLPVLVLAGELAGRILFFGSVVHTASNLGGLY